MPKKNTSNGSAHTCDIRLRKFDMSSIGDGKKLVFIGKTNSGKSCLVLDYLYHPRLPNWNCHFTNR